jgi:hypothetical protein
MNTATAETIQAYGISGVCYTFWLYPWGTQFKPVGGVYLVLRVSAGTTYVVYVGQTGDLSERFDNHHKRSCFDRNAKTHLAVLMEGVEARRHRLEQDLIGKYTPPCNDTI